jgi:hypothetical protein
MRLFTDITNPFIINGTNTGPVTARCPFGEIDFLLILFEWVSTPAAIKASFGHLSSALGTEQERHWFITMRTPHLLLLDIKISDKPFDIPFISFQFGEKFLGPFVRKEPIKIIVLLRKENIEIDLSLLLLLRMKRLGLLALLFHNLSILYRIASPFCQLQMFSSE